MCREINKEIKMTKSDQLEMFGADMELFVAHIKNTSTYQFDGVAGIIAGMMSDAQEEMANGYKYNARKTLNRAKHLLFMAMDNELVLHKPRN
jgi:hypothetical protein